MSASPDRVLILGGTTESRLLAARLTEAGVPVISSLAGRLAAPRLPDGEVHVGGFGGPDGLAGWLAEQGIVAVVDATHPFAASISESAAVACRQVGLPLARVERPGWQPQVGDRWHRVTSLEDAARLVPELGRRALLAIGRQGVGAFAQVDTVWFLVRCIEPPTDPLPPHHQLTLARGPFTVEDELELLREHKIDVTVTKDSGGSATDAKLVAARSLGLPVLMVDRPARPPVAVTVSDVAAAVDWVSGVLGGRAEQSHGAAFDSAASHSR